MFETDLIKPIDRTFAPGTSANAIPITRGLTGIPVTVTTSPVLLAQSSFARSVMVVNPTRSKGNTSTNIICNATTVNAGETTQASALGCANYKSAHIFAFAGGGSGGAVSLIQQSQDPATLRWMDVQTIFSELATQIAYYEYVDTRGIGTNLSFRFGGSGQLTSFSLTVVLKEGLGGTPSGSSTAVFLGGSSGISVTSGFPLLEEQYQIFALNENTELWGVANVSTNVRVFYL